MEDTSIKEALKRCAVGLSARETVEEFALADGELVLVKKKIITRDIPPDIKAVKMILDGEEASALSDEQLIEEREKLIKLLKEDNSD